MRYADPNLCPDCRSPLPASPPACPSCDLPLNHRLASELFGTLQRADALLVSLRAVRRVAPPLPPAPTPAPRRTGPRRVGLRVTSVPGLLLSLGALCLLVAAVIFLAVAWSWLGIGGRTAVLVGLTTAVGALAVRLERRGLRVAAESLTTVTLGLVLMDAAGAVDAGWFGDLDLSGGLTLAGAGLGLVAAGLLALAPRLGSAQAGVALGVALLLAGIDGMTGHDDLFSVLAVLALAALARTGRQAPTLVAVSGMVAAVWWGRLAVAAAEEVPAHLSVHGLWVEGHGYAALAAAALLVLPGVVLAQRSVLVGGLAGTAVLGTAVVAAPALDESPTAVGVAALAALLAWTAATVVLPHPWRLVSVGPLLLASLPAVAVALDVAAVSVDRLGAAPWTAAAHATVSGPDPASHPALLLALVVATLLAAAVWLPLGTSGWRPAATVPAVAAVLTVAAYDVPLALVTGVAAALALALRSTVLGLLAVAVALPSAVLATAACAAAAGTALLLRRSVRGDLLLPLAVTGVLASLLEVLAVDPELRAYPVVLALGLLALARPRPVLEAVAATCAALATAAAVTDPTPLAVHLTLAGALAVVSGLVHPHRRVAGWVGGALLAAATWLRLADVGVVQPEAYTLPSAVALVLVALHRLRRDHAAPTWLLVPGLTLATIPSLLWVLDDPVSTRAVLLGGACLGLVLTGSRLRWSAPLAVGGGVGALLVLRELAPYAGQTPQWVLIGLAGTVLVAVGVTWEQRVLELRRATTYLERLR